MRIGVIDIETSHFFDKGGQILEVAMAILDTETRSINKAFTSICTERNKEAIGEDAWVFENSSLNYDDVMKCEVYFDEILPELQKLVDGCDLVTAYNKAFDFEFLKDRGLVINNEAKCLMLESTPICKIPAPWYMVKKNPDQPFKWPSCEESWAVMYPDIEYVEAHRAIDDAIHEALICWKLISKYGVDMKEEIKNDNSSS